MGSLMCGRYAIHSSPRTMRELFVYFEQPNFPPRYNIAPTQPVPVIRLEREAHHFTLMRWGLIPSWAKEMPRSVLINARAETIAGKPSFRGAFRHHRGLMPADGYYEWHVTQAGAKQPYFIRRRDGQPLAMAAIWENWMSANGSEMDTSALITTQASEAIMPLHHRMPVILEKDDWAAWLDPAATEKELLSLLKPAANKLLEAIPVSTRINKVANDDSSLIEHAGSVEPAPPATPEKTKSGPDRRQIDLFQERQCGAGK